jgi:hypothetical protein
VVANVNPAGAIAGYCIDANNVFHGFLRTREGTFATFEVPGAGIGAFQGTFAVGNNPANAVTGYFIDTNGVSHGFLRIP